MYLVLLLRKMNYLGRPKKQVWSPSKILLVRLSSYSSSSQPVFVSQWHAHSREVVFHTLHRVQRDTIICPLIIYRLIRVLATVAPSQESSFTSIRQFSPPSFSAAASDASLSPAILCPACSHHCIPTCSPGDLSYP